jgi:hypothetical protein
VENRPYVIGCKQNWTISGVKNTGLNKLIDGETINVTTKTGKSIKVKFEGGMEQNRI